MESKYTEIVIDMYDIFEKVFNWIILVILMITSPVWVLLAVVNKRAKSCYPDDFMDDMHFN